MRLAVAALDQMLGQRLDPLGLDRRDLTRVELGGLDHLGRHHPLGRLLGHTGARVDEEASVARAEILAIFLLEAEIGEQPGQQRAMQ